MPTTIFGRQPSRVFTLESHTSQLTSTSVFLSFLLHGTRRGILLLFLQPDRLLPLSRLWADLPRSCPSRKTRRSQLYLSFEIFAYPSRYLTFYQHFLAVHAWFALLNRLTFTTHRLLTARPTSIFSSTSSTLPVCFARPRAVALFLQILQSSNLASISFCIPTSFLCVR